MKKFSKQKTTIIMVLLLILVILSLGLYWFINKNQAQEKADDKRNEQVSTKKVKSVNRSHILIVYFSRSGQNYPGVNLTRGNTARIADEIKKVTGAQIFEIKPRVAYPKSYDQTVSQAEREQKNNAGPKIKGKLPKVSKYDTIFLGYPIWWDDIPMIVRTFMDQVDLNNKTIIPFSTNASSGWGKSLNTIHSVFPKAKLKKGFEIKGENAASAKAKVDSWLHDLGY
ncbi:MULTISPECIES: flavodoxin [Lactobacillus]|uniref:Flavodoxin n=1 Tax=Lactobacillus kullabergensis TaxID=1218493 RepID=A0ABN5LLQ1_9LACO|nr:MULTISPECIES: flavodoxin [Lactobacillus]AWM75114.1 flavodoxin [Lactobacillus kullabergensis]MBI0111218.1 NAD(P)H-dependent oxidoreductase [Lactobacillus sp. W8093]RMC55021.1 flavodoxin [Lactobacillus sp. ESL0261]UZX32151.1 NAD(P)H-dependent oxidoreductase [Lactobacillus helsingborgensis]